MVEYKALVVIQVRFSSARLAGKALLPLNGMPMLAYLIRRLKKTLPSSYLIVVATTNKKEDDLVVKCAEVEKVKIVRGEEDNVLARYIKCIETFPSNVVIRVTGDNPLTDPWLITETVKRFKESEYDYVRSIRGFPSGVGVDGFSDRLLRISYDKSTSSYEREHIDAYVLKHRNRFKIAEITPPPELNYPDVRLTVDTDEDYKKVKEIVESHPCDYMIKAENAIERAYKRNI